MRLRSIACSPGALAALVAGACGGLAGNGTAGDDDAACPDETVGWRVLEHGKLPKGARPGWFAVSTGSEVIDVHPASSSVRLTALWLDLATGRFHLSQFGDMGRLASIGPPTYVWTGEKLLVFGTFIQGDEPISTPPRGLVYDPDGDRWTPMSTQGQPKWVDCYVWTGAELLAFSSNGSGPLNTLAYDPVTDQWREREALAIDGAPLNGCRAVWTGDAGFVWAYADTEAPDVPAQFDPVANEWHLLSTDPELPRRYQSKIAYSGGVVLLWGGTDPDLPVPEAYAELPPRRYVVDTDTWLAVNTEGPQPEERFSNVMAVSEGFLVQGAGDVDQSDFGFFYEPNEDRWFALQQGCVAEPKTFFGELLSTDYGVILWRGATELGEPIAWRYQGPLR